MRTARTAAAVALAALTLAFGATPAQAHTTLRDASPGIDSTVSPPSQIVLTYEDPVRLPQVVLTSSAGVRLVTGRPLAVDNKVTTQLTSELPNGSYTVGWRVVAVDGHPVEGSYRFTVIGSSTTQAPAAASATKPTDAKSSSDAVWWIGLGGLLVVAAAAGVVLLRRSLNTDEEG